MLIRSQGGGSTFGVMTKVTLTAFPTEPLATFRGRLSGTPGADPYWNSIVAFHSAWARHLAPLGCTGYSTGNVVGEGILTLTIHYPGARNAHELQDQLDRVFNETVRAANGGNVSVTGSTTWREELHQFTVYRYRNNTNSTAETFPGNGRNKLLTSWLYGFDELTHPNVKEALMGSVDDDSLMYQDWTAGPGTHKPPFMRGGGNAVNPGWRTAIVRPAAELQWSGTDRVKLAQRKRDLLKMGESLRLLGPEMGTYCNEADVDMPNTQKAFWGVNYPRLLAIKQQVDPLGIFYCKSCVGSEFWEETREGGLCPKSRHYY
jgi:hypothetical protein